MGDFHPDDKRAKLAEATAQLSGLVTKVAEKGQTRREELARAVDAVHDRMDTLEALNQKAGLARSSSSAVEGRGPLLTLGQKAAPHFETGSEDFNAHNVRLGALVCAAMHYDRVKSQLTPDEIKALSILTDPSGGMLLPSSIGSLWIDAVRPKTQVLNAGALTYAMETLNVLLPGWDTPPKAGWRGHGGQFGDAGGSFRQVELNARDCGCYLDVPQVLFEDAGANLEAVSTLVEAQLSKAIAQALDLAALTSQDVINTGGGTAIPQGLSSIDSTGHVSANYGINLSNVTGTNGATPTWDNLIDNVATVLGANFTPTAHLSAPRAFASLAKLKDTQLRYLGRPDYLSILGDYPTSQVPLNLTKGTSSDCTASYIGDFSQMVIGLRSEIRLLVDPYTQGLGRTTRLVVWQKADVGILNKTAFQVIDGVRP
jgi:HK97 family phage major capsid protein